MAFSTLNGYRKILERNWRPKLATREFLSVTYSELVAIAGERGRETKNTQNNGISPLRCAFKFGYKDHVGLTSPAEGLESFRIEKGTIKIRGQYARHTTFMSVRTKL